MMERDLIIKIEEGDQEHTTTIKMMIKEIK